MEYSGQSMQMLSMTALEVLLREPRLDKRDPEPRPCELCGEMARCDVDRKVPCHKGVAMRPVICSTFAEAATW